MVAYLKLMRFHKPVGIALLWLPTAWALWFANNAHPPAKLVMLFLLGTIFMRAAGCVVNDIADRNIDKHVKRTSMRPLTSGQIGLRAATVLLIVLLMAACLIVLQLPIACFYYALLALPVTLIYPFCKRFFQAPQLMLGIAFSMSIPMVYSASGKSVDFNMALLMLICLLWTMSYDTMYAMVDRDDDLKIGVKSTAVLLAEFDSLALLLLQGIFHTLWLALAYQAKFTVWFFGFWFIAGLWLIYQQKLVKSREREACFKAFNLNIGYGTLMWIALMAH